ncbi:hypothetical protein GCM10010974_18750 [Brevibacterium sediminis]|uniref:Uncharacterized protein n=1 Tax=Brevibacterium sediminis TaxID=1857024 RepID=A0ABQ1MBZ5_9MICO|nr:hypothetical protein GCM10010974_18750 [Brevibacterium sediminis]
MGATVRHLRASGQTALAAHNNGRAAQTARFEHLFYAQTEQLTIFFAKTLAHNTHEWASLYEDRAR